MPCSDMGGLLEPVRRPCRRDGAAGPAAKGGKPRLRLCKLCNRPRASRIRQPRRRRQTHLGTRRERASSRHPRRQFHLSRGGGYAARARPPRHPGRRLLGRVPGLGDRRIRGLDLAPTGYIDADTARWLVATLSAGHGPTENAARIAFEVVKEAEKADEALLAFAMRGAKNRTRRNEREPAESVAA